jgi:hypothetical protein
VLRLVRPVLRLVRPVLHLVRPVLRLVLRRHRREEEVGVPRRRHREEEVGVLRRRRREEVGVVPRRRHREVGVVRLRLLQVRLGLRAELLRLLPLKGTRCVNSYVSYRNPIRFSFSDLLNTPIFLY